MFEGIKRAIHCKSKGYADEYAGSKRFQMDIEIAECDHEKFDGRGRAIPAAHAGGLRPSQTPVTVGFVV